LVLAHLPLGIDGTKIDDRLAFEILCYASLKRITIESACRELNQAPSGNTVREHLNAALSPEPEEMKELEARLNQTLRAQPPKEVWRRIEKKRIEVAIDLVEIPYHGEPELNEDEVRRGAAKIGIETSYRQAHQVRAWTTSRNPALRLLLFGLALLIVNLWVLMRQTWVQMTSNGSRARVVELTLERMADALLDHLKQLLGFIPVFQIKAVLHGTKLIS
jgi:hypothetical protein